MEINKEVGSTGSSDQCLGLQELWDYGEKGSSWNVSITEGFMEEVALQLDFADGVTPPWEEGKVRTLKAGAIACPGYRERKLGIRENS